MQEGDEAADRPAGKPVKWANPILQKRAWSNAWLALLAMPLPEGILRKVPLCAAHAKATSSQRTLMLLTCDFLPVFCQQYPEHCGKPATGIVRAWGEG